MAMLIERISMLGMDGVRDMKLRDQSQAVNLVCVEKIASVVVGCDYLLGI